MQNEEDESAAIPPTLETDVNRGGMTISQYLSRQGGAVRAGLDGADESGAVSIETDQETRKYEVGGLVAKGGMGAILSARDLNIRRTVAMKVMLRPREATEPQVVRFIEEAQVTGQLEHPGIVPVHELSMDAGGNVFYTMKFVEGATLKDIIEGVRQGKPDIIGKYPLNRLLNIFLKTCDAIAFAHTRNVVHRDLKPENIMVGDYGEVSVMDWGLAKILSGKSDGGDTPDSPAPGAIDSVRHDDESDDALRTMDGQVMGTPMFMAPEQALGKISEIDARTDIYALGAILYNILALRPPVQGKSVNQVLLNVSQGKITPPSALNPTDTALERRRSKPRAQSARELQRRAMEAASKARKGKAGQSVPFPHCPGSRIPSALSAVAMKALATKRDDRYQSVKELQDDIEAYQGGFATSAEDAGALRQVVLFAGRHKLEVAMAAASVLIIASLTGGFLLKVVASEKRATLNERRAVAALGVAEDEKSKALAAREAEQTQREQAEAALESAEYANYCNLIALADSKVCSGEVDQAERLLWQTPETLRGWEWGRLMYVCCQDLAVLRGHVSGLLAVDVSPDGKRIVTGSRDKTARIWDAESGRELLVLGGRAGKIWSVAFSPDGRRVATANDDGAARIWDAATGRECVKLTGHGKWVRGVAFSPDGKLAATASDDNTARIWNPDTGWQVRAFEGHEGPVTCVCFSPDGRQVATASRDRTARIWDVATGRQILAMRGHARGVISVAFSPDGTRIISAGNDRTARIWDAATGVELLVLRGHTYHVYSTVFSPDGNTAVTLQDSGHDRLWHAFAPTISREELEQRKRDRHRQWLERGR